MKIILTGGGSGGHITPILAVAHELKQLQPGVEIIYIGQRGDALADIPARDPNIDAVYTVLAGKLRRYADESWLKRLTDIKTVTLNIRDMFRVLCGTWQSYRLLHQLKPEVVFTRGGFVSVPVAIGGWLNHIPYLTHDSDAIPSLANRLIAAKATIHAVALPKELYPYPQTKTITVGVPIGAKYEPVTPQLRKHYRNLLKLNEYEQVLFLTGGGNGARALNEVLVSNARYLLSTFPHLVIVHAAGKAHETEVNAEYDALGLGNARSRVQVFGFVNDLYRYSGAADVVIARGGATNLAEFAVQQLACLIIPAPQLVGDHQSKNAEAMAERGAIVRLSEDQAEQPERLGRTISELLQDDAKRAELGHRLSDFAHPHAAAELAALVLKVGSGEANALA